MVSTETRSNVNHSFASDIKGFLTFGNWIGVMPVSAGVLTHSACKYKHRHFNRLLQLYYGCVTLILCISPGYSFFQFFRSPKGNAFKIADAMKSSLGGMLAVFVRVYLLFTQNKLTEFFRILWKSSNPPSLVQRDIYLKRDIVLLVSGIFVSAILENAALHRNYFSVSDDLHTSVSSNISVLQAHLQNTSVLYTYFKRAQPEWSSIFPYHWCISILSFISHKWLLYAWNYLDVFIAVMARVFYGQFQGLYFTTEEKLLGPNGLKGVVAHGSKQISPGTLITVVITVLLTFFSVFVCTTDQKAWIQACVDHQNICRLVKLFDNFISPLVFYSYFVNVFYICITLFYSMAPITLKEISHADELTSIHALWTPLHLFVRTFIVSLSCARINEWANKILDIIQECPIQYVTREIKRLERRVTNGPSIGFSGMGCFVVTKPFILTVVGVVFTFEIVLLQCVPIQSEFSSQGYF